jgi:hypothetical protein
MDKEMMENIANVRRMQGIADAVLIDRARFERLLAVARAAMPGEIGPDGPSDVDWAENLGAHLAKLVPGDLDPIP